MFIAFEGPDKTGKSTSAAALSSSSPIYNATKGNYTNALAEMQGEPGVVQCFDRIDWLTHMTYRLALPDYEWQDPRIRTVFAMPDTHLVFKLHRMTTARDIEDELYSSGTLETVNYMYEHMAKFFMNLNEQRDYALFKTVTIIEVDNRKDKPFTSQLRYFSSPNEVRYNSHVQGIPGDDEILMKLLSYHEQRIG